MKKVILFVLFLSVISLSNAQIINKHTPNIGFGLQVVQPRGDFANQYDGYPIGLSGNLSIPIRRSPLEIGASFAWNNMGSQDENVNVNVGKDINGNDVFSQGTLRIRSNNYRYAGFMRFRPFAGAVQPYIDGLIGFDQFRTTTDIQIDNSGFSSATQQRDEQRDFSLNIGYAGGIRVRVAPHMFFDARFENITGGKATYVDQNTISVVKDTQIKYETRSSNTNKYTYQLGFAIQF